MNQPILYCHQELTATQVEKLHELAPNHKIIFAADSITHDMLDNIEIMYGWNKKIGTQLLDSPTSRLFWIQVTSAGVNHLNLKKIQQKGVLLSNGSGIHNIPITESVMGMILGHTRGLYPSIAAQQNKEWKIPETLSELSDKKMLIVGTGNIGAHLAKIAKAFNLTVFGINRSGHHVDDFEAIFPQNEIDKILNRMDIVVNLLPLTKETENFYDDARFEKMKDGVLFINVGRGESVHTAALVAALKSGKIGFAGLDVLDQEPLPATSDLWETENLLITPHISGIAEHFKKRLFYIFETNLKSVLNGQKLSMNQVDLERGY